jgi:hypothetical protein
MEGRKKYLIGLVITLAIGLVAGYAFAAYPQQRAYPYSITEFWAKEVIDGGSFEILSPPLALAISEYDFTEGDMEGSGKFIALVNLDEFTGFGHFENDVSVDGLEGSFRGITYLFLTGPNSSTGEFIGEGSGDFEGWYMKGTLSKEGNELVMEGQLLKPIN